MEPVRPLDARGFFRSLFDFSFSSFITTKVIRALYVLLVIVISLVALVWFIAGLASGKAGGILIALIAVPIGYVLYLVFARIWLEFLIVVFRIGEDIRAIRLEGGFGGGTARPPTAPPAPPLG
jgi:hypothetical protein